MIYSGKRSGLEDHKKMGSLGVNTRHLLLNLDPLLLQGPVVGIVIMLMGSSYTVHSVSEHNFYTMLKHYKV